MSFFFSTCAAGDRKCGVLACGFRGTLTLTALAGHETIKNTASIGDKACDQSRDSKFFMTSKECHFTFESEGCEKIAAGCLLAFHAHFTHPLFASPCPPPPFLLPCVCLFC
jgi:hypothetical protein